MEKILLNIMKRNPHNWVRYWLTTETTGVTLSGEYVEIRSNYLTDDTLKELFDAGFKIDKITTQIINADAYCEVLLKRKIDFVLVGSFSSEDLIRFARWVNDSKDNPKMYHVKQWIESQNNAA